MKLESLKALYEKERGIALSDEVFNSEDVDNVYIEMRKLDNVTYNYIRLLEDKVKELLELRNLSISDLDK